MKVEMKHYKLPVALLESVNMLKTTTDRIFNEMIKRVDDVIRDQLELMGFDPANPPPINRVIVQGSGYDVYWVKKGSDKLVLCLVNDVKCGYDSDDFLNNKFTIAQDIKAPTPGSIVHLHHVLPEKCYDSDNYKLDLLVHLVNKGGS